ncbi:LytTR family DNA-binding domain-containing protein [Chryseolinea lacunae]|uniref:LytTR family transcriptional regulator DNA-binding domain-containing protein n=1 Tax=Chryseolinea lacunae TaxID=2801331 RepID=A0ABS1L1U4_9BACT|nr:LytTR family DNA-binding domain-containing protein [Chryseolinea lacunae]MBL0745660.1 LytTR family transcriptional regulator DNA-binding domain-containing protein [Chryseolinea lacunae]
MKRFDNRGAETATSILVPYKDKIIPVKLQDAAVFFLENDVVHMITFNQKEYFPGKNLEELEKISGKNFFRANRQVLVNRNAVTDVSNQMGRKLWVNVSVPVKESITISREKMPQFLKWLSGE